MIARHVIDSDDSDSTGALVPAVSDSSMSDSSMPGKSMPGEQPKETLADLVSACIGGADGAWPRFVDRHAGLVWLVLSTFDLSANDRREAFHSTFVAAWTNLSALRNPDRLHVWLARIARNEVHRFFRDRRPTISPEQLRELPNSSIGPEEHLRALEVVHEVRTAVEELPQPYRATLESYLATGGKVDRERLAEELGVKPESVRKTKARAFAMLRTRLVAFTESSLGRKVTT